MGTAVITHGDAPPVLKFGEHVLDFVPLFVEIFVIINRLFAVLSGRDAGRYSLSSQRRTEPIAVIASICQHFFDSGQFVDKQRSPRVIANIPFSQNHGHWLAVAIADGV